MSTTGVLLAIFGAAAGGILVGFAVSSRIWQAEIRRAAEEAGREFFRKDREPVEHPKLCVCARCLGDATPEDLDARYREEARRNRAKKP